MEFAYSAERNVQIVLALLKAHGIKKVVASPGTTNITLVHSMQHDPWFEVYSSVDERSAAYIACGLAGESGEPVVLSCTGATASRNYAPGLTEAYYRKLPILAITSTQQLHRIGHLHPQVLDRSVCPNDMVNLSLQIPSVKDDEDAWDCNIKVNRAILELKRNGGGPIHLNLSTTYNKDFSTKEPPTVRKIDRIYPTSLFPSLPQGKIAIFAGPLFIWTQPLVDAIDEFCEKYNSVVFCDHTCNYNGKYKMLFSLVTSQELAVPDINIVDLLIHIGNIPGEYAVPKAREVWRVSEDGEIRDTFKRLRYVFQMPEVEFFKQYSQAPALNSKDTFYTACANEYKNIYDIIDSDKLPFSNVWIAYTMAPKIPENSVLHFGILNTLRSWNLFNIPRSVKTNSNTGGYGIDGCLSTLIGASLISRDKLYFGFIGDLAFFYDMNVVGNRHVGNNVRIMVINNGRGTEFRQYNNFAASFGDEADEFIAAARHFGNQSRTLIKHYAEDLGYSYLSAWDKKSFMSVYESFVNPNLIEKPVIFEVFTDSINESEALHMVRLIRKNPKGKIKRVIKNIIGEKGADFIKKKILKV